jgi:outer membrane protein, heavy metal efflux system
MLTLAGCASTSAKAPFEDVSRTVTARTGHAIRWNQGTDDDRAADAAIDRLLAKDLDANAAVQVSLLANPSLQASFEELAIAQADLVQAGLLQNPTFAIGRTAWESEHIAPNLFASVEQDFLELLTMPLRKRIAGAELEKTKLEIADRVLVLAGEVRHAFYTAQAAEQILAMRRLVEEASAVSSELARRQHDAGNLSELALRSQLALAAQTSLDRKRAEGEVAASREKLNQLMGTWGPRTSWRTTARLPDLPAEEVPLEHLESLAIANRFDLAAARRNVQTIEGALSLAKTTRWVGKVNVNVEAGRLRESKHLSFGPSVALEIPLFDQRQAQIARLEAYGRQAERTLQSLAIDIRAEVREARARVLTTRAVASEYATVVVPLRERVVKLSQEQYDAMLLGVYALVQAKQAELDAWRESVEALRDYWIARSDLERAVGAPLGPKPT